MYFDTVLAPHGTYFSRSLFRDLACLFKTRKPPRLPEFDADIQFALAAHVPILGFLLLKDFLYG